jgi:WhiB family transcriptional regulator, redox-sensing transcriptional regulator
LLHALTAEEKLVRLVAHIDRELDNMDWRHKAVCRDEDPELFFPVGNSGPAIAQIADAKLVCNRCPVTTECLTWALDSGQDAGVWGGMSEDERRALKRRNARTKARTGV